VNGSAGRRKSGLEVESETVAATPPTVRQLATYDYMVVEEGAGRPVVDKILCRLEIESVYGSFVVAARMVCGRSMFGNESQSADDRRRVLPGVVSSRPTIWDCIFALFLHC
jgi:hypothetical protein